MDQILRDLSEALITVGQPSKPRDLHNERITKSPASVFCHLNVLIYFTLTSKYIHQLRLYVFRREENAYRK